MCKTDFFGYCENCQEQSFFEYSPTNKYGDEPYKCRKCKKRMGEKIKKSSIKDRAKQVPLDIRIEVAITHMLLKLPSDLGYRKPVAWSEEERKRYNKIYKIADKESKEIMKLIKQWMKDGMPKISK